jgi:hypothetical protein
MLPTTHFRGLDLDNDGALSAAEWAEYYAYSPKGVPRQYQAFDPIGYGPRLVDFRCGDEDMDAHLSWPEYHELYFRLKYCAERRADPGTQSIVMPSNKSMEPTCDE